MNENGNLMLIFSAHDGFFRNIIFHDNIGNTLLSAVNGNIDFLYQTPIGHSQYSHSHITLIQLLLQHFTDTFILGFRYFKN